MLVNRNEAGRTRDYSPEEEKELGSHRSSSQILNDARRAAGMKGPEVAVRGDDQRLDDWLEAQKTEVGVCDALASGHDAIDVGSAIGLRFGKLGALLETPLGIVGTGAAVLLYTQCALANLQNAKDEKRDVATRDTLHGAMLMSLELPQGFRDQEIGKLGLSTTKQSPVIKISDQIIGSPVQAKLQALCDDGVQAAGRMLDVSADAKAYMKSNPDVAKRYSEDAAFRAGFDAMVWAKKNAPVDGKQMLEDARARDPRSANPTQVRG